jgi:hypothetical protein
MKTKISHQHSNGVKVLYIAHSKDMFLLHQDRGVTFAVMVTMEIQQDGLDQFGCACHAIVTRTLILMLLGIATEPQESV